MRVNTVVNILQNSAPISIIWVQVYSFGRYGVVYVDGDDNDQNDDGVRATLCPGNVFEEQR